MSYKLKGTPHVLAGMFTLIPTEIRQNLVADIHKCLKENGPYWTIDRFKAIRLCFIQTYANPDKQKQYVKDLSWVAKRHGLLKGYLNTLMSLSLKSERHFEHAIQLLSLYQSIEPTTPRNEDIIKFKEAVNSKAAPVEPYKLGWYLGNGTHRRRAARLEGSRHRYPELTLPSRHRYTIRKLRDVTVNPWLRGNYEALKELAAFLSEEYDTFSEYTGHSSLSFFNEGITNVRSLDCSDWNRGEVHFRVQPGGKLRTYYAAPKWMHAITEPLSEVYYNILRDHPSDCTFNQRKAIQWSQDLLSKGKTIYAFDLSSATDRLPWSHAKETIYHYLSKVLGVRLYKYAHDFYLSLYEWMFNEERIPVPGLNTVVSWKTGQPLGMQLSFAILALQHHSIVAQAYANAHKTYGGSFPPLHDSYRILGDDIIIADPHVAHEYERCMQQLHVEISRSKSVISSRLTEFAGLLITPTRAFYKAKPLPIHDRTAVALVDTYGPKAVRVFRDSQKKLVSLPSPTGRDVNPLGISYDIRLRVMDQLIEDRESKDTFFKKPYSFSDQLIPDLLRRRYFRKSRLDSHEEPTIHVGKSEIPKLGTIPSTWEERYLAGELFFPVGKVPQVNHWVSPYATSRFVRRVNTLFNQLLN